MKFVTLLIMEQLTKEDRKLLSNYEDLKEPKPAELMTKLVKAVVYKRNQVGLPTYDIEHSFEPEFQEYIQQRQTLNQDLAKHRARGREARLTTYNDEDI